MHNFRWKIGFLLLFILTIQYLCAQHLELSGKFENCSSDLNFKLNVSNKTKAGLYTAYRIEWGDGDQMELTTSSASHTYVRKGHFVLLFYGKKADGTEDHVSYDVYNDGGSPELKLAAGGESGLCRGSEISFVLSGLQNNTDLTSYVLEYGDGAREEFNGSKYSGQAEIVFKHRYDKSYCDFLNEGGDAAGMKIKIQATNACGGIFEMTAGPYKVANPIDMKFHFPAKECTGNEIDFAAFTKYEPDDCMEVNMIWDILGVEDNVAIPYVFDRRGDYTIRATAIREDIACSQKTARHVLKIIQRVKAIVTPLKATICEGETLLLDASASEGDEREFNWSLIGGSSSNVQWQSDRKSEKVQLTFTRHGSYRIQLQLDNGCSYDYAYVDVVVKKDPEIQRFGSLPALCPNKILMLKDYVAYDWTWEGNVHRPTWTIEGPEGGAVYALGDEHAEFPYLRFTKPGVYTLTVELTGVGCGDGAKLKASRTITIYDPAITGEITHSDLEVCENTAIVFTNQMQGVHLTTAWQVTKADGSSAAGSYTMVTSDEQKTTTFKFSKYGDYKIKASLSAECSSDSREYHVKVHKAPEVFFREFPGIVCPETPFLPGEYVDLRPNGNDAQITFSWKVTSVGEIALLEGGNSRNPKITFPTYGDYTIELEINNPTSCTSPSLKVSRVLTVSNPEMNLKIVPDRTTICAGQEVVFRNTSDVAVEPEYYWGISPEGYHFVSAGGETSRQPTVGFTKSGIYSVTAVVNGVCRPETLPYTIIVQEDPEVALDAIPASCPGMLEINEELVHYTWNDSWKSGAESTRRVVWKLKSKPDGAVYTPEESLEWNAFYPRLEFQTPGKYELQVEVKSDASCGGSRMVASQEVIVYDPALRIEVKPEETTDVIRLGGVNEYQAVEGSPVTFINTSSGQGLHCVWSVDQPDNAEISDVTADAPSITFKKYGTYKVRVELIGTCSTDYREFTLVVKGIPKFNFVSIANRCEGSEEIDIRDYLTCDSAGSTEIICTWNISPSVGYTITEGSTSDLFYKIRFNATGNYTLTLNAKAEYGEVQVKSQIVHVLRNTIVAKAELSHTEGCTTDGFEVVALNRSDGDSVTYTWQITPIEGTEVVMTPEKLTAQVTQTGDYQIWLQAENICDVQEVTYPVRAYAKPEIAVIGSTDLGTVCEKDYQFIGSEHVGEIQVNHDDLKWVRWSVSPEGAGWINGTNANQERPDIHFEGDKHYVITGEFKNGCQEVVKVSYTVAVDKYVPVELMPDTVVCAHTRPFLLRAVPEGGVWSCADEGVLKNQEEKVYFNPYENEDGEFELTYARGNGKCMASELMQIIVRQLPVVEAGDDRSVCLNGEPVRLQGIQPAVGEWKGAGVLAGIFHPENTGVGEYRLEYWYTEAATGCPNLDTIRMRVDPLPDPDFKASDIQCRVTDSLYVPLELGLGHRFAWDFGNGEMRETEDTEARYQYPAVGEYQVVVTATSAHGCQQTSAPFGVKVLDLPPTADFTLLDTAQCGPFSVLPIVQPDHFTGDYYNLKYTWEYGNGQFSRDLQPEEQIYQSALFDTTYQLVFKVYNACGQETDTANIGVWSKAVAGFVMNPEEEGCTPAEVLFINQSTGSHNSYSWDFGDGTQVNTVDTTHVFTTTSNMSVFQIRLSAFNRCTPGGTLSERLLKVKPNTIVAGFTKSKKYLCAGDTVCFDNYSVDRDSDAALVYSWDFGDGQVAAVWDTCHLYENPGAYEVKLSVGNGCATKAFSDSVFVHVVPVLQLDGEGALCEDIDLELSVSSNEPLKDIRWDFGDGTLQATGSFRMKHAFQEPGLYVVKVSGEADQIPSCPGEVVKTIEVWSNPRVTIQPLDTMVCPPLLYRPQLTATSYDYFTWDYGDGSPLTSEMQHLYTNDTNFIQVYHLTAYVENNFGCKEEHQGLIRIYNGPKAAWDKEISYGRPEKVRFINLSRDYSEIIWYLPSGEEVHAQDDQTVTFTDEGVYPMSLAVVNQYGCRDSIYQDYRSYKGGLYFPNSFIPHSTNPKVSHFNGIGMGLKEYKLQVFDMYGNKVWETRALDGGVPAEGWDGRNKEGKLLPQGTYMWRAEAVFFSEDVWTGQNNRSGKAQSTQGTVLLLRK